MSDNRPTTDSTTGDAQARRVRIVEAPPRQTTSTANPTIARTATDKAKSAVLTSLASLPATIKPFIVQNYDRFLTAHKELVRLRSKRERFNDEEYVPVSARIKLPLGFSDYARENNKEGCEHTQMAANQAVAACRKSLKAALALAMDAEIKAKEMYNNKLFLTLVDTLVRLLLTTKGYLSRAKKDNDVHHLVCVEVIKEPTCRRHTGITSAADQKGWDTFFSITKHIKHKPVRDLPPINPDASPDLLRDDDEDAPIYDREDDELASNAVSELMPLFKTFFNTSISVYDNSTAEFKREQEAKLYAEKQQKEQATQAVAIALEDDKLTKETIEKYVAAKIASTTKSL